MKKAEREAIHWYQMESRDDIQKRLLEICEDEGPSVGILVHEVAILEVLLDIRDLLLNKKDDK